MIDRESPYLKYVLLHFCYLLLMGLHFTLAIRVDSTAMAPVIPHAQFILEGQHKTNLKLTHGSYRGMYVYYLSIHQLPRSHANN